MSSRKELANTIRALSMDAVQKTESGHPDTSMGMADIAEILWHDFLKYDPQNPSWTDRDRFMLSNGHGSILIYSLPHLIGCDLPMGELKNLRQLYSKTSNHPEVGYTTGVETTTGPLGRDITNAVGMATAEETLTAQPNRPGHDIVDHYTYAFMGDGCMMKGTSREVCSLAGVLKLDKPIASYDNDGISIDSHVGGRFTNDTAIRFEAYGWHVIHDIDGHDAALIKHAAEEAHTVTDKPPPLIYKTIIGFGSSNRAGAHDSHGVPLGGAEVALAREQLGWKYTPLEIPSETYARWDAKGADQTKESAWGGKFATYAKVYPQETVGSTRRMKGEMPSNFDTKVKEFITKLQADPARVTNRKASQNAIEAFGPLLPEFPGGSVDLAPSNLTLWSSSKATNEDVAGNYIHHSVREFGVTAIVNGISLYGGSLPCTSISLMLMKYTRNAVCMAALMKRRQVMIYTHNSIGLGEDSPTYQSVERIASLRVAPNASTRRPCGQVESAVAQKYGVECQDGPTAFILSCQNLAQQERTEEQPANIARGGYVLKDCTGQPELIFITTGSGVELAVTAYEKLTIEGVRARMISMPFTDAFNKQDVAYHEFVLSKAATAHVAAEVGIADYWYKYVGLNGAIVGVTTSGGSAPAEQLFEEFGFTVDNATAKAKALL